MKKRNARRKQWDALQRKAFKHHEWSRRFVMNELLHDAIRPTSWWGNHFRY